jgi:outer membrane protein assembly factor BamB
MPSLKCNAFVSLGLLIAVFMGERSSASEWPRFRGPNGTGIASSEDIPVTWDEQSVLWKIELPGAGHSSPIVWGGRVFLQTASTDGKERSLLCLSATDGKQIWSAEIPGTRGRAHQKNSQASSTPATDGERVYAIFWDGKELGLSAYDFQGKLTWKRNLGPFKSQHGPGTSPIVHDGRVFIANDQDGTSVVQAFDARSGEPLWQVARPAFRACYSTPFVLAPQGAAAQLIVSSTAGVTSYEPQTGAEQWRWEWKFDSSPLRTVASAIYANGLIFAISGDGSGARHAVAVKAGAADKSQSPVWENKKTMPYVPSLLAAGDYIYYAHDRGLAGCCAAKTGETIWTERLGGPVSASPVLIDGNVFAASEDGNVYVFRAAPSFTLLAKNSLGEPMLATPAVANHRLYVRTADHLYCIGKPSLRRVSSAAGSK